MHKETITYRSSLDDTGPLYADVCFRADGAPKPLVLVMHGYSGGREAVAEDIVDLSERGVFAVAPDMRGHGQSAGTMDSGGLEVHDIADAAFAAVRAFPGEIDASNFNVVGYSGGGGNAIAAGCRFPDLFNTCVSFFGIPDYGGWYADNTRPDCMAVMAQQLGTPAESPARYEARNFIPAAGNARNTHWWFFWDREETMCPPSYVQKWVSTAGESGVPSVHASVTGPGDARRWIHNYRAGNPDLKYADDLFLPDVFSPPSELSLPERGELVVPGYVVTSRFSVFVADGTKGRIRARYKITRDGAEISVIEDPRGLPVRTGPGWHALRA